MILEERNFCLLSEVGLTGPHYSLIEGLQRREDNDGILELPEQGFKFGDKVRIAEGIMEGFEAIFQCQKSNDLVILLLKIAENITRIDIESSQIEPT